MSSTDVSALAAAIDFLRFNVTISDYSLPNEPENYAQRSRAALKAAGYRHLANAYRALINAAPNHPDAFQWRADMDAAQGTLAFWIDTEQFWADRLDAEHAAT